MNELLKGCYREPGERLPVARIRLPSKNKPTGNICDENEAEKNEAGDPRLSMPVFIGRNGMAENHHGQRRGRLLPAWAPELITQRSKEKGSRLSGNPRQVQHDTGDDATHR